MDRRRVEKVESRKPNNFYPLFKASLYALSMSSHQKAKIDDSAVDTATGFCGSSTVHCQLLCQTPIPSYPGPITVEDLRKLLEQFSSGFDEEIGDRRKIRDILCAIIDPATASHDEEIRMHIYDISDKFVALQQALYKHESIYDIIKMVLNTLKTNEQHLRLLIDRMEATTSLTISMVDGFAIYSTLLNTLSTAVRTVLTLSDERVEKSNVAFQQFEQRLNARLDALSSVLIPIPSSSGSRIGSCSKREAYPKNFPDSEGSGDDTEEEHSNSENEGSFEHITITDLEPFPEADERQFIAPVHTPSQSTSSSRSAENDFFLYSSNNNSLRGLIEEPEQEPIELCIRRGRKLKTFTDIFGGFLIVFWIFHLFNWIFFDFETENANNLFSGLVGFWFMFIVSGRALLSYWGERIWSQF